MWLARENPLPNTTANLLPSLLPTLPTHLPPQVMYVKSTMGPRFQIYF